MVQYCGELDEKVPNVYTVRMSRICSVNLYICHTLCACTAQEGGGGLVQ